MLLALLIGLFAVALFVATLQLTPSPPGRVTLLPPAPPAARKA